MVCACATLATLAVATMAAPLAAQATCDVDPRTVGTQLGAIALLVPKHDQQPTPAGRIEVAKQAIRALTDNPKRFRNEPVRNFLLGQFYVRWYLDQGPSPRLRARRGDVGFSEDQDGEFLLPEAMDSAMSIVEREKPACSDSTARYRSALLSGVLNTAIARVNAKAYDDAVEFASAALQINVRSPYLGTAFQVLAKSSPFAGNPTVGISALERAIERLGTDAATAPTRATATLTQGNLVRDQAAKLDGEARSAGLRRAAALFKTAADLAPNGPDAGAAMLAYARAVKDAGDTGAVASIHADMMANPGKYTALQLFEAGVAQAKAERFADAATLYESGLRKNPWYRDALFNAANVFLALHQPDKMAGVVERLRAADPMNPDVLRLAGAVWQERGRLASDANARKMSQDSVMAYLDRASRLPARVSVTQFAVGGDNHVTLAGTVQNLGSATASFVVQFDLLDQTGAVVGTVMAAAEQVAAKAGHDFSALVAVSGAVAWRYTMK